MRLLRLLPLAFLFSCTHVFYQPSRNTYYPPELYGLAKEDVSFTSSDGVVLRGWYFPPVLPAAGRGRRAAPRGTIVQFHGNAENMTSHYMSLAWLVKRGYALFSFDYRGYGGSGGTPSQEGLYKDGMSALDAAWDRHVRSGAGKFIVYGQSLGGAVALRSFADFRHQEGTGLVVMDSTFLSYKSVARRALAAHWLTWLFSPLGALLVSDEYSPEKVVGRLHYARLLVIHDHRDPVVAFQNGLDLYHAAPPPKEIWELDSGRHAGVFVAEADGAHDRERFVALLGSLP